jgi:hypothetical protein
MPCVSTIGIRLAHRQAGQGKDAPLITDMVDDARGLTGALGTEPGRRSAGFVEYAR